MSPKPRRAQQEVSLASTTTTTTTPTSTAAATTPVAPTNIEEQPENAKVEEEMKEEVEEDLDTCIKENEELANEEAAERLEMVPEGTTPDEDSEKPVEECPNANEPLPEGEPSVASRLMGGQGDGVNFSVEGLGISEDQREGRDDKVMEQVKS